jgi:hypothetical protein
MPSALRANDDGEAGAAGLGAMTRLVTAALSPRRPAPSAGREAIASWGLRLVAAGLLVWIAGIHVRLWQEGYKFIPTDGPLFLLDAIVAFALAAAILAWAAPLTGLLATGFVAATLGALIISLTVGLFGFRESIAASFVVLSIELESVATLVLLGCTAFAASASSRRIR